MLASVSGCALFAGNDPDPLTPELRQLERLAEDFYVRLGNRRVDSIATYRDPGLREFFRSEQDFADYYAALVRELSQAHFEANRPTRILVERLEPDEDGRVRIELRMYGRNDRPLRWWRARLRRTDLWERDEADLWRIRPGKV